MNLLSQLCIYTTDSVIFWIILMAQTIIEPILIVHTDHDDFDDGIQVYNMGLGTLLVFIQVVTVVTVQWQHIEEMKADVSYTLDRVYRVIKMEQEELLIEAFFVIIGWTFLLHHQGIAALRCFKVFRLLWFYKVPAVTEFMYKYGTCVFSKGTVHTIFSIMKFAVLSIDALFNELFFITEKSRGGLLLIIILTYCAFVFGMTLWLETRHEYVGCQEVGECVFTMIRLTVLDGNGLDFAFQLVHDHPHLFVLCMLYACISAFGLINGLVGVFGTVFLRATEASFLDEDDDDESLESDSKNRPNFVQAGGNMHGGAFPAHTGNEAKVKPFEDAPQDDVPQDVEGTASSANEKPAPQPKLPHKRHFGEASNHKINTAAGPAGGSNALLVVGGTSFMGLTQVSRGRKHVRPTASAAQSSEDATAMTDVILERVDRTEQRLVRLEKYIETMMERQIEIQRSLNSLSGNSNKSGRVV